MSSNTTTRNRRKEAQGKSSSGAKPSFARATTGKGAANKPTSTAKPEELDDKKPDASAGPTPEFATAREFAQAIAKERNLVEVGSALLGSEETKGASVRARMFETTLEYLYGRPAAAPTPDPLPVRVVWDIPASPPDEPPE